MLVFVVVHAPWGPIDALVGEDGVLAVNTVGTGDAPLPVTAGSAAAVPLAEATGSPAGRMAALVRDALEAYVAGHVRAIAAVRLAPARLSGFDRAVFDGVRQIPPGCVTSYGALARRIGWRGAARAVGGAVGRNRLGLFIPCHRVIAGDGSLGGYGGDPFGGRDTALRVKRALLEHEGVSVPVPRSAILDALPASRVSPR